MAMYAGRTAHAISKKKGGIIASVKMARLARIAGRIHVWLMFAVIMEIANEERLAIFAIVHLGELIF